MLSLLWLALRVVTGAFLILWALCAFTLDKETKAREGRGRWWLLIMGLLSLISLVL